MSAGAGRRSLWPARLLLVLLGLLVSLAVVELGVRVLRPQAPGAVDLPPLLRGQYVQPGAYSNASAEFSVQVQVNSAGFVDREWTAPPPGVTRIAVIGDSFVQATQVEMDQGFGRVLEDAMNAATGGTVQVLSLGVPGAGTGTALGLLEQYALPQDPQLVVLGFLLSNDVLNNHPLLESKDDKPFYRLEGGKLVPTDAQQTRASRWRVPGLWWGSHTWRLLARTVVSRQASRASLASGQGLPLDLRVHDPLGGPTWEEAWAVTDALVGAMAERCHERGVPFATLIFPSQVEATAAGRERAIAAWPELASWDLSAAGERAAAMAARHGPVLDLTPALGAAQHEAQLYYTQDGHWTPTGHRMAARAAAPFLAGLLDE